VLGNLRNLAIAELRSATDALTGLPNRRAIEDTLKRMVAQSSRTVAPLAALMCDLDHFKIINDKFGHGSGDDLLAAVGAALADTVRASDFVGRYGGEEFLILLPATGTDGALDIAARVRDAVSDIRVPSVAQNITLSVGIAVLPDHAVDAGSLERATDRALYAAKNGGRDRIEVFGADTASVSSAAEAG
jgi:diguanylate cyclase (GGDEF)-like protein